MYLRRVEIENVRSIAAATMAFPEGDEAGWHVVLGDNGSGKSTLVRAVALAFIGVHKAPALRLRLLDWVRCGETAGVVELDYSWAPVWDQIKAEGPGDVVGKVRFGIGEAGALWLHGSDQLWSELPGWFSSSFGPFRRFTGGNRESERVFESIPLAARHLTAFGEDVALTECISWLCKQHVLILEKREDPEFLDTIKAFINESGLLPHGAKIVEVLSDAVYFDDGRGAKVEVEELSDGFRSILSLTIELLRQLSQCFGPEKLFERREGKLVVAPPGVVLIDEVDAHLHPNWQTRIGGWFTEHFPRIQFIVTTHSPLICRAAENHTIWKLAGPHEPEHGQSDLTEITGEAKARLVYGNVLDAYESEGFELAGQTRSRSGQEKLKRLAILARKERKQPDSLDSAERQELQELQHLFPGQVNGA